MDLLKEIELYLKQSPPTYGNLQYRKYLYLLSAQIISEKEKMQMLEEKTKRLEEVLRNYLEERKT